MKNNLIAAVWKPLGWTPLQAVEAFKKHKEEYRKEKVSYAGRLDPMAQGVLLLLIGQENKKRRQYENLSKVYEAEMVLGITTDSFDALGLITSCNPQSKNETEIRQVLAGFIGRQAQLFPPYSSKAVNGKPLFWWARNNRMSEIVIPGKQVEISSIKLLGRSSLTAKRLYKKAAERISKVSGNFRQLEILEGWKSFAREYAKENFTYVKIRVSCSSGTYIRQLVSDIGEKLGCGSFALSITRTQVGEYMKPLSLIF